MQVILVESVDNLGTIGQEVTVKSGYARNFLIPTGKALRANNENRTYFAAKKEELEKVNLEKLDAANKAKESIKDHYFVLIRQASDEGKLYGSVTPKDIKSAIADKIQDFDKKDIIVNDSFKQVGLYEIQVKFHTDITASVQLVVARSEDEAEFLKLSSQEKPSLEE